MKTPCNLLMSKFTEADYDFSDVESEPDVSACYWYEYARESRAARTEIAAERKQRKESKGKTRQVKFGPRVQNLVQSHILMQLSFCAGFPNMPWRCLSDKDKQPVLRMIASFSKLLLYMQTWHSPPLSFVLNEPGTTTLDMWKQKYQERRPALSDSEPIMFGFFAVNLKYGYPVLLEEFKGYLRHFEGKPMIEFPPVATKPVESKAPGRKGIRDALNALGAMRLRYYCDKFSEAQKRMDALKDKPNRMFYGRRDNANRACDLALRHFQKLFGWLDSESPIHFTKGWRGGTQK